MDKVDSTVYEIDLLRIARAILKRIWAVILAIVVFGAAFFSYAAFFITPTYTATGMFYVNSSSVSLSSALSISTGDLAAAKSLVNTYIVILKSRSTLNEVIDRAELSYSYEELSEMISASAVNDTEVFRVSVTSTDPKEAKDIVNTIASVLPEKIETVVAGTSMRIVDYAVTPRTKSAPSITRYTAIGIVIGAVLSIGLIVIFDLMDDFVHSQDDLLQKFDLPVLASIPNLNGSSGSDKYYRNYYYSNYYKKPKQEKSE